MLLTDTLEAPTLARICKDGTLVAEVNAARTGIQDYAGSEIDPENVHGMRDQAVVRLFRPESEVFSAASMASYAAAPFTIGHPAEMVDASNWKQHGVGEVNGDVIRDGQRVRVPVIVRDAQAVNTVTTTHKQLSMGYDARLDFTAGVHDGQPYDAVVRDIRINHIAAVRNARGGADLRISDERITPPAKEPRKVKTLIIDGLTVKLDDAEAVEALVTKLTGKVDTATKALADATTAHDKAMAGKDAEIDDLKSKVVDEATIDARAAIKADVLSNALKIADGVDFKGKGVVDIRRMAVAKKLGDAAVAGKSDDYVEARFDALVLAPGKDTLKDALGDTVNIGDAQALYDAAMLKRRADTSNAWRGSAAAAA